MHSFQPSRGRVLFDFACALGMVVSCVGAWKQTGASALLAGASVAALFGFVRLFDLARPRPTETVEPQRIDFEPEAEEIPVQPQAPFVPFIVGEPVANYKVEEAETVAEAEAVEVVEVAEVVEAVELAAPRASKARKTKSPRKGGGRRASASKEPAAAPPEEQEEVALVVPMLREENAVEPMLHDEAVDEPAASDEEVAEEMFLDEEAHPHIAPLFEPDPFGRMPRRAFGRRGQL